ncbi:MAG: hypothetical protein PSV22_00435, partial [Pseudolabrys sp.]|nr:hypothetical protein [Pseudolabrys sp.]
CAGLPQSRPRPRLGGGDRVSGEIGAGVMMKLFSVIPENKTSVIPAQKREARLPHYAGIQLLRTI